MVADGSGCSELNLAADRAGALFNTVQLIGRLLNSCPIAPVVAYCVIGYLVIACRAGFALINLIAALSAVFAGGRNGFLKLKVVCKLSDNLGIGIAAD